MVASTLVKASGRPKDRPYVTMFELPGFQGSEDATKVFVQQGERCLPTRTPFQPSSENRSMKTMLVPCALPWALFSTIGILSTTQVAGQPTSPRSHDSASQSTGPASRGPGQGMPTDADLATQQLADARHDRTVVAYDGITPNRMVCDTTLRELPDGTWVLYFLAGGDFEPSPQNYTAVTRSTDQGRTWSPIEPVNVGFPREGRTIGQGPTEFITYEGRSTLFFATHSQTWGRDWQSWKMHSLDGGRTWGKPEPLPGRLAKNTFIRASIVTKNGRILLPFQHYLGPRPGTRSPPPEEAPWHFSLFHYVSDPRLGVLISNDGGRTWSEHGNVSITPDFRYHGWAEPSIVELADGRIGMIIRADRLGGVLYSAESNDGGMTWPLEATKTDIPNPGSKATLHSLGGDVVALLHNPNPARRSPLALWVSYDGMRTWPYRRVLVPESSDGPSGRLNYPEGFVSADKQYLHFAYDDNRHRAVYYGAKLPPVDPGLVVKRAGTR